MVYDDLGKTWKNLNTETSDTNSHVDFVGYEFNGKDIKSGSSGSKYALMVYSDIIKEIIITLRSLLMIFIMDLEVIRVCIFTIKLSLQMWLIVVVP